ncbi:MAG: NnrS family protein [Hyphomicrobiales bacterium]|nr:NnrS family protein [Hyphomicrobiales bacterium]
MRPSTPGPGILFAAPHRLAFLVGSVNLLLLAAWWSLELAGRQLGWSLLPQTQAPAALLHGPLMLFLIFPAFVFGFLLTVFPRWMGYKDLGPASFGPVAGFMALGSLGVQAGIWTGEDWLVSSGFGVIVIGWAIALFVLVQIVLTNHRDKKPVCWHALSALLALVAGVIALALIILFLQTSDAAYWLAGSRLATIGFLAPVFMTVAHRMVPFFANSVVRGYAPWRPYWLLAVNWLLVCLRLCGEFLEIETAALAANAGLAAVTALMCWKWWPRTAAPGLLIVLFLGFAWAPVGFAMSALADAGQLPGRAPDHALYIGFAGSLLVAMVTRVTHGHSGRPLAMPAIGWVAFTSLQIAALFRIIAAVRYEDIWLLILAGSIFLAGLAPWTLRNIVIYGTPRKDGKPG